MKLSKKNLMIETLMVYLHLYYWFMGQKNMCQKLCRIVKEIPWQKIRFSQHVQKTEHTSWGWFGIFHGAQRKLVPKFNFFCKNPQKVIED